MTAILLQSDGTIEYFSADKQTFPCKKAANWLCLRTGSCNNPLLPLLGKICCRSGPIRIIAWLY